jgi:hypothetical protein
MYSRNVFLFAVIVLLLVAYSFGMAFWINGGISR